MGRTQVQNAVAFHMMLMLFCCNKCQCSSLKNPKMSQRFSHGSNSPMNHVPSSTNTSSKMKMKLCAGKLFQETELSTNLME